MDRGPNQKKKKIAWAFFFRCALLFLLRDRRTNNREKDRERNREIKREISFIRYRALGVPIAWRHAWAALSPPQQCFSFCWSVIIVPRHISSAYLDAAQIMRTCLHCGRCLCVACWHGAHISSVSPVRIFFFFFYLVSSLTSTDLSHPLSSCAPSSSPHSLSHRRRHRHRYTYSNPDLIYPTAKTKKKKNSRTLECVIREDQLGAGGRSGMQKQQKARNSEPTAIAVFVFFPVYLIGTLQGRDMLRTHIWTSIHPCSTITYERFFSFSCVLFWTSVLILLPIVHFDQVTLMACSTCLWEDRSLLLFPLLCSVLSVGVTEFQKQSRKMFFHGFWVGEHAVGLRDLDLGHWTKAKKERMRTWLLITHRPSGPNKMRCPPPFFFFSSSQYFLFTIFLPTFLTAPSHHFPTTKVIAHKSNPFHSSSSFFFPNRLDLSVAETPKRTNCYLFLFSPPRSIPNPARQCTTFPLSVFSFSFFL